MLPRVEPGASESLPLWIVCEDGTEYLERYARFLGQHFRFGHAADGPALLAALADGEGAEGVLLDLDFRRTPAERLVDEDGRTDPALPGERQRRLAGHQGILILRLLRNSGFSVPVLLCADLEDREQASYLERTLAPLLIVPSHEGLLELAAKMRRR